MPKDLRVTQNTKNTKQPSRGTKDWPVLAVRIPRDIYNKLHKLYKERDKRADIIRDLITDHVNS